ncbi:MAG TPA: serine/threonine-protein kinase [Planctomycetota bacterium]|jgi:serine/threonine protein kinase
MASAVNGTAQDPSAGSSSGGNADKPPSTLVGRTLGQYRVLELIGQGGMGTVYRAVDVVLQRAVALKILATNTLDDPRHSERFLREARGLARLTHPNLVQVYNVGFEGDYCYFAMELVSGQTLTTAIRVRKSIPPAELLGYLGQILSALHYVHQQGIIHRDVKSSNIMLAGAAGTTGPGSRAVLMDFGLAKDQNQSGLTSVGAIVGTPDYMPPECAEGHSAGPAADIYSLGVVMYEALCGALPFSGRSAMSIIRQHLETPPPALKLPAGADARLQSIVHRCMQKKPEARYESCAALAADLASIAGTPELLALSKAPRLAQSAGSATMTLGDGDELDVEGFADAATIRASAPQQHAASAINTGAVTRAGIGPEDLTVRSASAPDTTAVIGDSGASRPWLAWLWVGAGFFGVLLLAFLFVRWRGGEPRQPSGHPVVLRKISGDSEEIRWIEFKAEGSDPSKWYHVIERQQPDGSWKRVTVPHQSLVRPDDTLELGPASEGAARPK